MYFNMFYVLQHSEPEIIDASMCESIKCNFADFRQAPRKCRPTGDKSNFTAAIKHQTQMKNSEQ